MNIQDACDYIVLRLTSAEASLNLLKLQKLLYYTQAWHLALKGSPLFEGRFQAWVHGPVSREVFDRFRDTKSLYSFVFKEDIRPTFDPGALSEEETHHINEVLDAYAGFTGDQLEDMTHREDPWIQARAGYGPFDRCMVEISEETMRQYYVARVAS